MDKLQAWWQQLDLSQLSSSIAVKVLTGVAVAILSVLFGLIARNLKEGFFKSRTRSKLLLQYKHYRDRLNTETFRIRHPWMKEGQVLEDILVSVNIETNESGATLEFQHFFDQHLRSGTVDRVSAPQHLVITGPPGSGKSVAMRIAARMAWGVQDDAGTPLRVPVLLSFATLRKHDFNVEEAAISSIQARGFAHRDAAQTELSRQFIRERLRDGILLLLDGLDELKREDRGTAINSLCIFAANHPAALLVLSCRSIPYREHRTQLGPLQLKELEMSKFAPAAVRRFVRQWKFEPPKSAAELISAIETKPHLQSMAENPLMLTIITFLYALPKYRLPDNRAQFYEICSRALLEEWDQSQAHERANQFDRPHKEELLARLACAHITGRDPESDIPESYVLDRFSEWLKEMGLAGGQEYKILNEIVNNSGLLASYPPDGLRFPHQTFLEYFAALYYLNYGQFTDLLALSGESRRSRETVLLYCGLATDASVTARIIRKALADDEVEFAIELICNARRLDEKATREAIAQAADRLKKAPSAGLLEHLGYLARSPTSAFAEEARRLLRKTLDQNLDLLPDSALEALILAVARSGEEPEIMRIIENFSRLRLPKILPNLGERALILIARVVAAKDLPREKLTQWIDSLRLAEMPKLLYETMNAAKEPEVRRRAGTALASLSNLDGFFEMIDDPDMSEPIAEPSLNKAMHRWGWPRPGPMTIRGQKILITVAIHTAQAMIEDNSFSAPKPYLHPWLSYLAHALAWEELFKTTTGNEVRDDTEPQNSISNSTPRLLLALWRKSEAQLLAMHKRELSSDFFSHVMPTVLCAASAPLMLIWSALALLWDGFWRLPREFALVFFGLSILAALIVSVYHFIENPSNSQGPSRLFGGLLLGTIIGPTPALAYLSYQWILYRKAQSRHHMLYKLLATLALSVLLAICLSLFCESWWFRLLLMLNLLLYFIIVNGKGLGFTPVLLTLASDDWSKTIPYLLKMPNNTRL